MGRDYNIVHYIRKQTEPLNDDKVTTVIQRAFDLIIKHKEHSGCLGMSVAIYIALKELGLNPILCYGLCHVADGVEFYHVWIELNNKVIDVAIYGNINFSPLMKNKVTIDRPIVLEQYEICGIEYKKFVFDEYWYFAEIHLAEDMTIAQYIQRAPNRVIYKIIGNILKEPMLYKLESIVSRYKDIKMSDFKNKFYSENENKTEAT